MRRSSIKRSTKPIRKRPRSKKEFARIYGSKERVEWVANRHCVINTVCRGIRCENAHVRGDGVGRKADAQFVVPMCGLHHRILHKQGVLTFQKMYNVDLEKLAAKTHAAWEAANVR